MSRCKLRIPPPHVHFVTIGEAALIAGLHRSAIVKLIKDRRLKTTMIPGDPAKTKRLSRHAVIMLRREMEIGLQKEVA